MADEEVDQLRARLEVYVGKPMGPPSVAPDAVNVPMIRHWVDALDDRNPVYLDQAFAATTRFGGIVAPPAMLQTWTMARPRIEGIAERGGAPEMHHDNPIIALNEAGYVGTLATNSEFDFVRYLRPGDHLHLTTEVESISSRKTTSLGKGYFLTWVTTYTIGGDEVVGRDRAHLVPDETLAVAAQNHDGVDVLVPFKCRVTAGLNVEETQLRSQLGG
jgi:acyl dehydratase